ncbi:hypothetical protein Tco_1356965 [Tanacetum coccineum]
MPVGFKCLEACGIYGHYIFAGSQHWYSWFNVPMTCLKSGKGRSSKKGERKNQNLSHDATYVVPALNMNITEEPLQVPSVHNSSFSNGTYNNAVGTYGKNDIKKAVSVGTGLDVDHAATTPESAEIIKIVNPVNYTISIENCIEDMCVSLLVRRSDGEEVVVDNKYLKENNPVLLINYYEKHLRYSIS